MTSRPPPADLLNLEPSGPVAPVRLIPGGGLSIGDDAEALPVLPDRVRGRMGASNLDKGVGTALTVIAARERTRRPPEDHGLIPLTVNEIRRLFAKLITNTVHTIGHWLAWSRWRRQHQARAETSHYRRRGQLVNQPTST